MPDVPVTTFAEYVVAPGPARPDVVRRMQTRQAEPYDVRRDFYRSLRKSIGDGRRVGRDRAVLEATISNAHEKKKSSFRRLTDRWLELLDGPFAGGDWIEVRTGRWTPVDFGIKVSPVLGLVYPDGIREAIFFHFPAPVPQPEVVRAELRVMELAAEETGMNVIPVLVELQRGVVHRPDPETDPEYNALLVAEAAGMSVLMNRLSAA